MLTLLNLLSKTSNHIDLRRIMAEANVGDLHIFLGVFSSLDEMMLNSKYEI